MAKLEPAQRARPLPHHAQRGYRSALNIACLVVALGSALLALLPLLTWALVDNPRPLPARLLCLQAGVGLALLGIAVGALRLAQRRR